MDIRQIFSTIFIAFGHYFKREFGIRISFNIYLQINLWIFKKTFQLVNIRYRSVFNVLSTLVAYALQSKKLSSKFFAPNPELALKRIERVLNHRPKKIDLFGNSTLAKK